MILIAFSEIQSPLNRTTRARYYWLTSNITAPRATHLHIFQFFSRNPYIMSNFPVLSTGISWWQIYVKTIRWIRQSILKVKKLLENKLTALQLLSKKMKAAAPHSTRINRITRTEYCTGLRKSTIYTCMSLF